MSRGKLIHGKVDLSTWEFDAPVPDLDHLFKRAVTATIRETLRSDPPWATFNDRDGGKERRLALTMLLPLGPSDGEDVVYRFDLNEMGMMFVEDRRRGGEGSGFRLDAEDMAEVSELANKFRALADRMEARAKKGKPFASEF